MIIIYYFPVLLYEGSGAHLTYNLEIEIILTFSHFFRNVQVLSVFLMGFRENSRIILLLKFFSGMRNCYYLTCHVVV